MAIRTNIRIATLVALLPLVTVTALQAQVRLAAAVATDPERAAQLHDRAMAAASDLRRLTEAADLLLEAAHLRSAEDPRSASDFMTAGRLFHYAGVNAMARKTIEHAALRYLEFGDVLSAAHALVDAAFLAAIDRDWAAVSESIAAARRLAASRLLSDEQRSFLLARSSIRTERLASLAR